jgi:hypothetical protein
MAAGLTDQRWTRQKLLRYQVPYPVWLKNSAASRRVAIIVAQQPTEAISTPHLAAVAPQGLTRGP